MRAAKRVASRYLKIAYRLSPRDKKVIDAFIMERPAEGKALFSDGRKLEKAGIMLSDFAKWINGKIHILSDEGTKSDEVILRYLIKKAGKGMVRFKYERANHPEPVSFYNNELSAFLHSGKPLTVYHGTVGDFKRFDAKYMREELLNHPEYVGNGFFFSVTKKTAYTYADSTRNSVITFDEVFPLLKKSLRSDLYEYAVHIYKHGWDEKLREILESRAPEGQPLGEYLDSLPVDLNNIVDIVDSIDGSHEKTQERDDTLNSLMSFFSGSSSSGRESVAIGLEEIGINADSIRPKILTCIVKADNVKLVRDLKEAKSARRDGYDAIIWYGGEHLVNNEPEVVIFNPRNIRISKVDVIK